MSGVCIISGCSRGIGRAIAKKLASTYSLGLLARSEQELQTLREELENDNKNSKNRYCAIRCDIQDEKSIK